MLETYDRASAYVALSYAWGQPTELQCSIQINNREVWIQPNCYYALWQAIPSQYFPADQLFWNDSICINQADTLEKNMQVERMHDTYRYADGTIACLGRAGNDSDHLFKALNSCATQAVDGEGQERLGTALHALDQQDYWTRLWILQELLLSRSATLLYGSTSAGFRPLIDFVRQYDELEDSHQYDITVPMHAVLQRMAQAHSGMQLSNALVAFRSWKCSNWRGRVYGLMGMATLQECTEPIKADYKIFRSALVAQIVPYIKADNLNTKDENIAIDCLYHALGLVRAPAQPEPPGPVAHVTGGRFVRTLDARSLADYHPTGKQYDRYGLNARRDLLKHIHDSLKDTEPGDNKS